MSYEWFHYETSWPDWGSAYPPKPYFNKQYFRGKYGDMHAGEILDRVHAPDVENVGAFREYIVLRCHPCVSIHVWPLPDVAALAAYYARTFYEQDKPDYLARYDQDREWWERCVHGPILHACIDAMPYRGQHPQMLEVGAGPGIALDLMQAKGWHTFAIEPDATCAARLAMHGHDVFHGTIESALVAYDILPACDLVYCYEVLEHQPCPEAFLLDCAEFMDVGSVIAIVVPNEYTPIQLAARVQHSLPAYWLVPPQHLHYFTPKTLQLLVRRAGFHIVDLRATYPIDRALLAGCNYVGDDALGRTVHQQRMQDELAVLAQGADAWRVREQIYRDNLRHRIGREIVCIARKE